MLEFNYYSYRWLRLEETDRTRHCFISQGREVVNNTKDICFFVIYLFFYETTVAYVNHDDKHLKISLLIKFRYDLSKCTYFFLILFFWSQMQ